MDPSVLAALFTATYSFDQNVRMAAELEIKKISDHDQLIPALVQVIGSSDVPLGTRQAAAVYLKNRFTSGNFAYDDPATERWITALKPAMLSLLVVSPSQSITMLLRATLGYLVKATWPEKWPDLEDRVRTLLVSQNGRELYVGLATLLEMLKAFRYGSTPIIPALTARTFPLVHPLARRVLTAVPTHDESQLLHLILKCYWMSIQQDLAPSLQDPDSIMPWGTLFLDVVSHQVPLSVQGASSDELASTPYWKAKKWAFRVLNRLFSKYGNPSQLPVLHRKTYLPFATKFISSFAPEILRRYLSLVELYITPGQEHGWMTERCLSLVLDFLTDSVRPKSTWELVKPHVGDLVRLLVYPLLCFTPAKNELWETDPVAFVQAHINNFEDLGWPDMAATALLVTLARSRGKTSYQIILTHISEIFSGYPTTYGPESKYGAMTMILALDDVFLNHPLSRNHVNDVLIQHIVPELNSPHAYMRSAACDVIAKFEENGIKWQNNQLVTTFDKIMQAMRDPELPVRVNASFAFSGLMEQREVRHLIAPHIGEIIQALLKLSDELGLDTLSAALDNVVAYFAEELKTLALPIVVHLRDSYVTLFEQIENLRLPDDETANVDEITDKTMAAIGVLRTIGVIIDSQKESPELLEAMQTPLLPVITQSIDRVAVDMFDEIYTLVDTLLNHLPTITPQMWQVFEATYRAFMETKADFFEDMTPILSAFIEKGSTTLAQKEDYCKMLVDMYGTIAFEDDAGAWDRRHASMLAETLIMQLPGLLLQFVPRLTEDCMHIITLDGPKSPQRAQKLNVLLSLLVYYPFETLVSLERQTATQWFLDQWLEDLPNFDRVHDLQLSIAVVSTLFQQPPDRVPPSLGELWPRLLAGALRAFKALPAAEKKRDEIAEQRVAEEQMEEEEEEEEVAEEDMALDEEEAVEEENDEEEDGDVVDEETAYINMLAEEAARLQRKNAARLGLVPDSSTSSATSSAAISASRVSIAPSDSYAGSDADEEDEEDEEDWFYETAVDQVDPYVRFRSAMEAFHSVNPGGYVAATAGMSSELSVELMEVGKKAMERAAARA